MCGIAGIFHRDRRPADPDVLVRMTRSLVHRGPDEEGYFLNRPDAAGCCAGVPLRGLERREGDGNVGLGHRRLSIIDLATGQQPLANEDGTIWITYNGEIYNFEELRRELESRGHAFRTHSDTEMIVHAWEEWGEEAVKRFRGMFAFALWDERKRVLWLGRDRLGKKPLYYCDFGGAFLFGSEIKAILQAPQPPRDIDPTALSDYLSLLYVPAPKTIFRHVRKLPQAHYAVVTERDLRIVPYWTLDFVPVRGEKPEALMEEIVEDLREATRIRLMSEVPLGAFLSGGVDSSAVVALMAGLSRAPVKTSSISFGDPRYDEAEYARLVAKRFSTEHREYPVTPDAVSVVEKLSWHYDEPFADSSAVPTYYVSRTAREQVTVALSGDGGDENFAGYRRYWFDLRENMVRGLLPRFLRRAVFGTLGRLYPKADYLPQWMRGKAFLSNVAREPVAAYFHSMSAFKEDRKPLLLRPEVARELAGYSTFDAYRTRYEEANAEDHLSRLLHLDIKTYLCDDILVKVDRASMAVSLEVRCPVLDQVFVEKAARIPAALKIVGREKKWVFKKALEGLLPREVLYRPKMGFSMPVAEWLRGELKEFAAGLLLEGEGTRAFFRREQVERLWQKHQSGLSNFQSELWILMMFNLWHRRFAGAAVPAAAGAAP
jgi:asparagine synthase (glutamine-hydrolysing)